MTWCGLLEHICPHCGRHCNKCMDMLDMIDTFIGEIILMESINRGGRILPVPELMVTRQNEE